MQVMCHDVSQQRELDQYMKDVVTLLNIRRFKFDFGISAKRMTTQ